MDDENNLKKDNEDNIVEKDFNTENNNTEKVDEHNEKKKNEKIVVVAGDGDDLDISKVYDHLNIENIPTDSDKTKNNIIIPGKKDQ